MGKNKKKKARPASGAPTDQQSNSIQYDPSAGEGATIRPACAKPSEDNEDTEEDIMHRARGIADPLLAAAGGDMVSFTNYVLQQNLVAERLAEVFPIDDEIDGNDGRQKDPSLRARGNDESNGHEDNQLSLIEVANILQNGRGSSPKAMMYEAMAEHLADNKAESGKKSTTEGYKKLEALGLFSDTKGNLQRDLRERKLLLLAKDRGKVLSLQDVSEHNLFMMALREKLGQRREALTKRARVISVLLNKTRDSRRIASLEADMQRIRVAERNFNEDIAAFNGELSWFHSCPSFRKAQEHVAEHWVSLGSGEHGLYVPRSEIEEDEAATFESMLAEMKLDGFDSPAAFHPAPKDRTQHNTPHLQDNTK